MTLDGSVDEVLALSQARTDPMPQPDRTPCHPYAGRWQRVLGFNALFLVMGLAVMSACHADSAPPTPPPSGPMKMGVSTHFDQGLPLELLDRISSLGFTTIRDDMPWGKGERRKGVYSFGIGESGFIEKACQHGLDVMLMVDPRNEAYDQGHTAYTPEAQNAFAKFLAALLDHYGDRCISGVEIGNEINSQGSSFPEGVDGAAAWSSLLRASRSAVGVRHGHIAILGGSTNAIGTGYLDQLFQHGALADVDGVAVHPYRPYPEGVDVELRHLNDVMAKNGPPKPIWATEIGNDFPTADEVPSFMVRSVALLSAAGVERAYWYDLLDETAYRNQGLFTADMRAKPASDAARTVNLLLSGTRAMRVDVGDPDIFAFRFGTTTVLWGAPRALTFTGTPRFLDASGHPIPAPATVAADPVIITGSYRFVLGPRMVLADSLYDFDRGPFAYFARRSNGEMIPLRLIDWTWSTHYGDPGLNPLELAAGGGIAAGDRNNSVAPTWRLTLPASGHMTVSGCITKKPEGDGLEVAIWKGDHMLYRGIAHDRLMISQPIDGQRGDQFDLTLSPHGSAAGNEAGARWRLTSGASATPPPCF